MSTETWSTVRRQGTDLHLTERNTFEPLGLETIFLRGGEDDQQLARLLRYTPNVEQFAFDVIEAV